ncbi:SusC/RagA family TonB-linked outer membrane protein [Bacteroidia bacterium]|nr:SusC/RagA family TonB-linked outer membrane protein [Bacteroidia bacterium]
MSLYAQSNEKSPESSPGRTVSGKIVDAATDKPVIGVRINLVDGSSSAMTDENGEFKIKIVSGSEVLIVNAEDYALREIPLQGKESVNISLFADAFSSNYGNIQTLLGERRKTSLDNTVKGASDFSLSPYTSIDTDIQTRLGGNVRAITRSGVSGIGAAFFVRGLNSLNANAQPLFVVDGIVWDNILSGTTVHQGFFTNPLATIDPNDIESVQLLSDGNSIYGSKGANGVVLINTVRGKSMTTRISADFTFGVNNKPKMISVMNASQYKVYMSDMIKGFLDDPRYSISDYWLDRQDFLTEDPKLSYYNKYHNDTDWTNNVYQNSNMQNYAVTINGGDEVALYNLSLGYAQDEGTVKNTDMQKLHARFNTDVKLFSKMFTKVDISISQLSRNLHDDGVDRITAPAYISLIKAPTLNAYRYTKSTGELSPKLEPADYLDPQGGISNPVALLENALGKSTNYNFSLRVNPTYNIKKNLQIGTTLGYRMNKLKESFFIPEEGIAEHQIVLYQWAFNEVRDLAQRQVSIFSNTKLDWNLQLNENSRLDLTGGFRFMSDSYESDLPKGYNSGNDNVKVLFKELSYKEIIGANNPWKSISWYANADYSFLDKYFVTATFDMDASSRFGKKTQSGLHFFDQSWAIFPSIGGAWLISTEDFMKDASAFNLLKLRANYGLTGNDDISNYAGRSYFQTIQYLNRAIGLQMANIRNDEIQWETSAKANAGLDVSLFNERLSLSADVFSSNTKNLLTQKTLKSITGLRSYWSNGGELKNQGYEFSFNVKPVNVNYFKWEIGASVGHYKNEVTALPDGAYTTDILGASVLTEVGKPVGVFYGYKTAGVFATTADAQAANISLVNTNGSLTPYEAGDIHFVDVNHDGKIDFTKNDDKQIIGDPNPDLYGSIYNRFNVKRLTLDVLFNYSYGNDVYNYLRYNLESGLGIYNQSTAMLNRWITEGQTTSMPKAVLGDPKGNATFSDRWIEDGSYLRLKTLTLSYELPSISTFLQGATIWAAANNVLTLTKYLGQDPEFSMGNGVLQQGIDAGLTPQGRSYYVGIKIKL